MLHYRVFMDIEAGHYAAFAQTDQSWISFYTCQFPQSGDIVLLD